MPTDEALIQKMIADRREQKYAAAVEAAKAEKPADASETDATKAEPLATFKAAYTSDDGVIYAIGAYAGNVDDDDDVLTTKALVKMAYDFTRSSTRTFKACHAEEIGAELVASMPGAPLLKSGRVLHYGETIPDDDPVVGIDLKAEPIAWFVGVKPTDPKVSELAKAGGLSGLSWGAFASREAIVE